MKILVYGVGVIGSVYAALLQESGCNVVLLARGPRADALRLHGLLLEEAASGKRTTTPITIIDHLAPAESYDW
jgi:2-dehydropantoate 2-reductase